MCRDRSPKEVLTLLSLVHGEVPGRNVPIHLGQGEKKLDVLGIIYGIFMVIVMDLICFNEF